jgi:hypothetical protein
MCATLASLALTALFLATTASADDRAATLALLTELQQHPVAATLAKRPGAATQLAPSDDAVTRSRDALERATRMQNAGDDTHARLAEGLALEWAETARDRARTTAVETKAHEAEVLRVEATARVERERALLEEAIARTGRLKAELAIETKKSGPGRGHEHTSNAAVNDVVAKPKGGTTRKAPPHATVAPPAARVDSDAPAQGAR